MSAVEFSESTKGGADAFRAEPDASPRESLSRPIAGLICTHQPDGEHRAMSENLSETSTHSETGSSSPFWPSIVPDAPAEKPRARAGRPPRDENRLPMHAPLSRHVVLDTIIELHSSGRLATRQVIADILNQPPSRVDEHVKALYQDGAIRRVLPGVYEPVLAVAASRAVSITRLLDGTVKLEVGDACIDLTPNESRAVASMLMGTAFDFSLINSTRDLADQIAELRAADYRRKASMQKLAQRVDACAPAPKIGRRPKPRIPT